jgi:SAM-dependent methyltransferase
MKVIKNSFYWNNFYKNFFFKKESSFARYVYKKIKYKKRAKILDVACGNGRDTFFFLNKGFDIKGLDISKTAIKNNKKFFRNNFFLKDICSKNFYIREKYHFIYCRFFLHTINENDESNFFKNLRKISTKKTIIFLEFRTIKDPLMNKGLLISKNERFFTHYRRFINTKNLVKKIMILKFNILKISSSFNYALFDKERPHICRLIIKLK